MELAFEYTTDLGAGLSPAAVHLSNGQIYVFGVDSGRMKAMKWAPPAGDVPWGTPDFQTKDIITVDKNLSLERIKNIPRVGIFGAWHQDPVLDKDNTVLTPERQRFAIWDAQNDISDYLDTGGLRIDLDNIISSGSFTFKNPDQYLSGEVDTRITPGNKLEFFFKAGDSAEYPMGVFYVDRVEMSVTGDTIGVECRNISGKVLKDQTFDTLNTYPKDVYAYVVEAVLKNAGVSDYDIQQPANPLTAWKFGAQFPPEMDFLTGMTELIQMSINWTIRETLDGKILAGNSTTFDPIKNMNSRYSFDRGTDLISRGVTRDDVDVYSKVCFQSKNTTTNATLRVYANVLHDMNWSYAPNKTLYINAPDDTDETELHDLADALTTRMALVGVIEQFSGPFRPHLLPGDEAEITAADGTKLLGLITTVSHSFGVGGFFTSFTVDSAGVKGKAQLSDIIAKVSNAKTKSSIKRLY